MASLPGAAMKKSSGYGSALSLARAISVSARAGTAALSAAAAASHTASGRWVSLACSQSSAAATSPQRTSSQRHSRLSGVAAFFNDSASRKVRLMAAAKRCQRCSRGSVSASKPRRRRRRFQTARCARRGRAISRAPFTFRMAAMSLGIYYWGARSCLPQANFSGDEEE